MLCDIMKESERYFVNERMYHRREWVGRIPWVGMCGSRCKDACVCVCVCVVYVILCLFVSLG